jgi:hypothetical protein
MNYIWLISGELEVSDGHSDENVFADLGNEKDAKQHVSRLM